MATLEGILDWLFVSGPEIVFDVAWIIEVLERRKRFRYQSWIYCFLSSFFISFGSSISTSLLYGAPLGVLHVNDATVWLVVLWFAMLFTPLHRITSSKLVKPFIVAGSAISWMRSICHHTDTAIGIWHHSFVAPIILGTVAGSTGGFVENLEGKLFGTQKDISGVAWGTKLAFFSAILYYSQHPLTFVPITPLFSTHFMRIVIGSMLVTLSWFAELGGININPLAFWDTFFTAVLAKNYQPTLPVIVIKDHQETKQHKKRQ